MSEIKVYHGSDCEVRVPSFGRGRDDADFGRGFYVTSDLIMAEKWASRKKRAVVNEYLLNTDELRSHVFLLDEEWLHFVIQNRTGNSLGILLPESDLLIGTTADDKLFATIEQYGDGFIDTQTAIAILNCIKVGQQICIRELSSDRIKELWAINAAERKQANQITSEMICNCHFSHSNELER